MWARFDDQYPLNRKVAALSDAAYRLHTEAIFWSNRNLMDGWIPADDLDLISQRVRNPAKFVSEMLRRGLLHEAGFKCDHDMCPADGSHSDGWVLHDFWEFQPSKAKVEEERAKNAERQRRFRERHGKAPQVGGNRNDGSNGVTDGGTNGSRDAFEQRDSNAVTNADVTAPRPDPSNTEEAKASSGAAKPRKQDPLWDALMAACGVDTTQITKSSRGAYNNAVKDLKDIEATPGQVTLRARKFQQQWPTASLTPTALVRRWSELGTGTAAPITEAETERCPKHKRQPKDHCQICDSETRGAA